MFECSARELYCLSIKGLFVESDHPPDTLVLLSLLCFLRCPSKCSQVVIAVSLALARRSSMSLGETLQMCGPVLVGRQSAASLTSFERRLLQWPRPDPVGIPVVAKACERVEYTHRRASRPVFLPSPFISTALDIARDRLSDKTNRFHCSTTYATARSCVCETERDKDAGGAHV